MRLPVKDRTINKCRFSLREVRKTVTVHDKPECLAASRRGLPPKKYATPKSRYRQPPKARGKSGCRCFIGRQVEYGVCTLPSRLRRPFLNLSASTMSRSTFHDSDERNGGRLRLAAKRSIAPCRTQKDRHLSRLRRQHLFLYILLQQKEHFDRPTMRKKSGR